MENIFKKYHCRKPIKPWEIFNPAKEAAMIKARDIMSTDLIVTGPDMEITKATALLLENRINGLPVVNDSGQLVGIICQSDLISQQKKLPIPSIFSFLDGFIPITSIKRIEKEAQKIAATRVSHAMTPNPVSIEPDTSIEAVAGLMVDSNFHTLPVVDNGRLVGIIGKEDVLKILLATPKNT